jgi:hypothetical protein
VENRSGSHALGANLAGLNHRDDPQPGARTLRGVRECRYSIQLHGQRPVAGMHGCGVSTPCAAVVAAATCGLARLLHIPKLGMLTFGAKSATVHATVVATAGLRVPLITDGLAPIEHRNWDPVVTMNGITDHTAKHHPRAAIRGRAQGVSTDVHPRT